MRSTLALALISIAVFGQSFLLNASEEKKTTMEVQALYNYIDELSQKHCDKMNCRIEILKISQEQAMNEICDAACLDKVKECKKKHEDMRGWLKKKFKTEKVWRITISRHPNEECIGAIDDGGITIYYDPIAKQVIEL